MTELELACQLFTKAAVHNRRAGRALVRVSLIFFRYRFVFMYIPVVDSKEAEP